MPPPKLSQIKIHCIKYESRGELQPKSLAFNCIAQFQAAFLYRLQLHGCLVSLTSVSLLQKSKADAVQPVQAEPDDEVSSEEASPSVDTRAQSSAASGCNPLKIVRSFRRKIRSNGQAHASEE